jgi:hypothetical protein
MEMKVVKKGNVARISTHPSPVQIMIDQKKPQNAENFNYFGSMITNDARCTRKIKSRVAMEIAIFNKKKTLFTSKLDSNLRKTLVKCHSRNMALYGAETRTLRKVHQKCLDITILKCGTGEGWRRSVGPIV